LKKQKLSGGAESKVELSLILIISNKLIIGAKCQEYEDQDMEACSSGPEKGLKSNCPV
jgi:hypothetical protein